MKFLVLCTLLLSIAFFMASAQAGDVAKPEELDPPKTPPHNHHNGVRSVRYADEPKKAPKGDAGCCG